MEAARSPETVASYCITAWGHNAEDHALTLVYVSINTD